MLVCGGVLGVRGVGDGWVGDLEVECEGDEDAKWSDSEGFGEVNFRVTNKSGHCISVTRKRQRK